MRGLGEIDIGRRHWRDEPFQIIQTLQSYLTITDASLAPDVVFKHGAEAASLAARHLEQLIDGRAFCEGLRDINNENGIFGDPVSPGVVEGIVRMALNLHETQLQLGKMTMRLQTGMRIRVDGSSGVIEILDE